MDVGVTHFFTTSQTTLVAVSPDLIPYFPDEQAVNKSLRALLNIAKAHPPRHG